MPRFALLLFFIPLIFLAIFAPMLYGMSGYVSTKKIDDLAIVYEINGERYLFMQNGFNYAIDRFGSKPHLYVNTFDFGGKDHLHCFAADFLALAFGDIRPYPASNPYFKGGLITNRARYCEEEKHYLNASDFYHRSIFKNPSGEIIYTYDTVQSNLYTKNIPISGTRSSSHFSYAMLTLTEHYADLTELLEKQGFILHIDIDKDTKAATIRLEPQPSVF